MICNLAGQVLPAQHIPRSAQSNAQAEDEGITAECRICKYACCHR